MANIESNTLLEKLTQINNIKNRLFHEYELSDREKKLFSIICNAVDNVNSLIYDNFNSCYIINRNDKFYIRLNINKISIIKNNSLYVFNITVDFFDYIKEHRILFYDKRH